MHTVDAAKQNHIDRRNCPIWDKIQSTNISSLTISLADIKGANELISYSQRGYLCSKSEYSFYCVLVKAVGSDFVVCPKIRVSDVLRPEPGMKGKKWWNAFNRISRKHFDYVICKSSSLAIVAVVELDDISHQSTKAEKIGAFKDFTAQDADLPLLCFCAQKIYKMKEIKHCLIENGVGCSKKSTR